MAKTVYSIQPPNISQTSSGVPTTEKEINQKNSNHKTPFKILSLQR